MPNPKRTPHIDFSAIQFPTDTISFGQLRKVFPESFTLDGVLNGRPQDIIPTSTLHLEMTLAEKAFAASAGIPDPHPEDDRLVAIAMLNEDYCRFGISTGLQQTRQLVTAFERQASLQASSAKGRSR